MPEVGEGQWSHGISSVSLIHGAMSIEYSCSGNVRTPSSCVWPLRFPPGTGCLL